MKSRTLIGSALTLSAFIYIGAGTFTLMSALSVQETNNRRDRATAMQCTEKLNDLAAFGNGTVETVRSNTVLTLKDFTDPRGALGTASLAMMMCPNKNVENICLGDQCEGAGNKVILKMIFSERQKT
jgi:hypothetical protein